MKYLNYYKEISNIKPGSILWACAYDKDNNYEHTLLFQKPVKGIVLSNEGEYKCKRWTGKLFFRLNKEGKPIKSSAVSLSARKYADTYEECVEIYNSLVNERIEYLKSIIKKAEDDIIVLEDN